ncbi:organic cation transporter protein [Diorhabda carinulata]|uniref:organic cation transporter protein n=1 Tax=Diorhabda carinulata TaxID=1163345 RepID=UPI00259FE71B|nr:organic cation transporter protein [Diorhabda carinulata]
MSYDDVISLLGEFGRYQRKIYFLLCLPAILCAFQKLGNVFLIAEPNYRCKLPTESDNASYYLNDTILSIYYPKDELHNKYSSCEILIDNKTQLCESYIFDHEVYGYTSVIEYGLTCSSAYLIATSNALFMVGVMLGSIIFGEMSDRIGRKITFFISLVILVVAGLVAAIAPELWTFTVARLIVGATTSGVFLVAYVIGLEMVGPSKRPIAGTVVQMFFSLGYMLTAAFAYYIDNWRWMQFALTIPGVAFFVYWWFIPESARWLLTKNRTEEAKKLIQEAAKYNDVVIPDETLDQLLESAKSSNCDKNAKAASVIDIFKYPNMRKKSLIIFFDWFANNLTYYGLSWNTNNLAGNPYLNFVMSGAVEIPAFLILLFLLNKWGRRNLMCCCMLISGISLLLTMIVPDDKQWLIVTLAMIGKLTITSSYGAVYILSTEQFPTVIRNAGLGAGSTFARFGSILAPYMNALVHVWQPLPLLVFGTCALIGGLMSLVLPETLNKKLPETMEEGEQFGKKTKKLVVKETTDDLEALNKVQNNTNRSEIGADEKLLQNSVS